MSLTANSIILSSVNYNARKKRDDLFYYFVLKLKSSTVGLQINKRSSFSLISSGKRFLILSGSAEYP